MSSQRCFRCSTSSLLLRNLESPGAFLMEKRQSLAMAGSDSREGISLAAGIETTWRICRAKPIEDLVKQLLLALGSSASGFNPWASRPTD